MNDLAIVRATAEPLPPELIEADLVDRLFDNPVFDGRTLVDRGA